MSPTLRSRSDAPPVVLLAADSLEVMMVDEPVAAASVAEPWDRRHLIGFTVSTALGAGLLGASYLGVSAEVHLKDQVPFLDLGIAGLLVGTIGGVRWLAAVLKSVRVRKAAALALVRSRFVPAGTVGLVGPTEGLVAAARMTRYHLAGCPLVAGKDVSAATLGEHSAAGRRPCGVCTP
jgi:hypothetical protein